MKKENNKNSRLIGKPEIEGNLNVNILQWVKTYPVKVAKMLGTLLLSFFLGITIHWIFSIVFLGALIYNIWYWIQVRFRFKSGDVNPGKVVSITPPLIAVITDMRKAYGGYPVIKIQETKLASEDKKLGKVIPTIAIYNDNPHGYPFWAEFHPVPLSHGIIDRKKIHYFSAAFSKEKIDILDYRLNQIGTITPGIYKVDEEISDWKNYAYIDLSKGVGIEKP